MPDQVFSSSARGLVALARSFRAARVFDARGQCLARSLDLALAARGQLGVELELVRWQVVDDADHLDHWAVRLDAHRVIDPTRVQVDGRRMLVGDIAAYPAHFQRPRAYPATLLLDAYRASMASSVDHRFTNAFAWTCGVRLLHHDLARSWRERDLRGATQAGSTFLQHMHCLARTAATRALERRSATLLQRLHQARVPAHCAATGVTGPARQPQPSVSVGAVSRLLATLHPSACGPAANACTTLLLLCA